MARYERSYGRARFVFTVLEVVGTLVILAGVIALFGGFNGLDQARSDIEAIAAISAIAFGILFALLGLISVAFIQTSRATVDQTEMTRDMLNLMRTGNGAASGGAQTPASDVQNVARGSLIKTHRGYQIIKDDAGVSVSGSVFAGVTQAEEFIDNLEKGK